MLSNHPWSAPAVSRGADRVTSFGTAAASGVIVASEEAGDRTVILDEPTHARLVELIAAVTQSDANRIATLVRPLVPLSRDLIRRIDRSTTADRADWSISGLAWTLQSIDTHIRRAGGAFPALTTFTAELLARLDLLHAEDPALLDGFAPADVMAWLERARTMSRAAG